MNKESLQGKMSKLLCDEKGLRPLDIEGSVPNCVTTDRALTKGRVKLGLAKQQI